MSASQENEKEKNGCHGSSGSINGMGKSISPCTLSASRCPGTAVRDVTTALPQSKRDKATGSCSSNAS